MKIRNLVILTMIIAGIVLVASGVFAAIYHYPYYTPLPPFIGPSVRLSPEGYVYPYASVGLVLGMLRLVMLIIGPLFLLVKLEN